MKVRKVISSLMLTLYMLAVGVPCMASITCRCTAHAALTAADCCRHDDCCGECGFNEADDCSCGHSHNLERRLYTADHGSENDALRRVNLIISAAVEPVVPLCVETVPVCHFCRVRHTRNAELPDAPEIAVSAFRAPPVVA